MLKRKIRQLRFLHYRTWTGNLAVSACEPAGWHFQTRDGLGPSHHQQTTDLNKVTCGECIERLKENGAWPSTTES